MRTRLQPFGVGDLDRVFGALSGWDDVAGFPFLRTTRQPSQPQFVHWTEDDTLFLRADVPGLALDDVSVSLTEQTLQLSARRTIEYGEEHKGHRLERPSWSLTRSIKLPFRPDPASVTASLRHGVLTLSARKEPEPAPRTISVTAG